MVPGQVDVAFLQCANLALSQDNAEQVPTRLLSVAMTPAAAHTPYFLWQDFIPETIDLSPQTVKPTKSSGCC